MGRPAGWPDLSALDSIGSPLASQCHPRADTLPQTLCILASLQGLYWGEKLSLSGFWFYIFKFCSGLSHGSVAKCHIWPRGNSKENLQKPKIKPCSQIILSKWRNFPQGYCWKKSTIQKSNIFSVAKLQHIPLIWFNLYIFQFRNRLTYPQRWSFWISHFHASPSKLNIITSSSTLTLRISKCIRCMLASSKHTMLASKLPLQVHIEQAKYHIMCTHNVPLLYPQ